MRDGSIRASAGLVVALNNVKKLKYVRNPKVFGKPLIVADEPKRMVSQNPLDMLVSAWPLKVTGQKNIYCSQKTFF